jgi:hypothetical protein
MSSDNASSPSATSSSSSGTTQSCPVAADTATPDLSSNIKMQLYHHEHIRADLPHPNDVLSGRGSGVNLHPGNTFYRSLVRFYKLQYANVKSSAKKEIIAKIIEEVKAKSPAGKFLKRNGKSNEWECLTLAEAKKKTGQALREDQSRLRDDEMLIQEQNGPFHSSSYDRNRTTSDSKSAGDARSFSSPEIRMAKDLMQFGGRASSVLGGAGAAGKDYRPVSSMEYMNGVNTNTMPMTLSDVYGHNPYANNNYYPTSYSRPDPSPYNYDNMVSAMERYPYGRVSKEESRKRVRFTY